MEDVIRRVTEKFDVLFSGLGTYAVQLVITAILALIGYLFFRKKYSSINNVNQRDIVAGGDVTGRDKKK